jgi:hypothetical protein
VSAGVQKVALQAYRCDIMMGDGHPLPDPGLSAQEVTTSAICMPANAAVSTTQPLHQASAAQLWLIGHAQSGAHQ